MPGIPRSTGCLTCKQRKKKCDEAKPTCGLCTKLGVKCIGNGAKRWKFMTYTAEEANSTVTRVSAATPRVSRSPSNEISSTAAALVHILEIQDARFDIRALGGSLMGDLPAQLGVSPELDTAVTAVVALYKSRQFKLASVDALTQYGRALTATRRALEKKAVTPVLTMQTMLMVYACQSMIDRKNSQRHRIMVAHVFRDTVLRGDAHLIDPGYILGLCQIAAWSAFVDPSFRLGDWFWEIHASCSIARPSYYQPGYTFLSLATDTTAAAAQYMQDPANNITQLRGIFNLVQTEKPRIRQLAAVASAAASGPTASPKAIRLQVSMLFTWATVLGFGSVINRVLRMFDDDASLVIDAIDTYDETLDLAARSAQFRPFGAGFIPDCLKAVWASTSDYVDGGEIEDILRDYDNDAEGSDHMGDAILVKQRLDNVLQKQNHKDHVRNSEGGNEGMEAGDNIKVENHACVVM